MGNHDGPGYSVIFVALSDQPAAFGVHFPQMVAVANQARTEREAIQLVGFSTSCQDRLSTCLGIPRVTAIALLKGAPGSAALMDFLQSHVPAVETHYLEEASSGLHRKTVAISSKVLVSAKRAKRT
jgi:ribonuclease P/MRP protein subunit POP3